MTYEITHIVEAVIGLCVAITTAFVIPWLRAKFGTERLQELLKWVSIAVSAAEQLYTSADGNEKKKYVLNFLDEHGIHADESEIDNAIEAAVLELHHQLYGAAK